MRKIIITLLPVLLFSSSCHKEDDLQQNNGDLFEIIQLENENITNISDISFYDDNNGIICGSTGFFAKTIDGGKTWTKLNIGVNHSFTSTFMLNTNTFYVARLGLYKTSNSGNSFNEIGNLSSTTTSIFDIHFNNNSTGFIVKNGAIKKTTDGGNTWVEKYFTGQYYGITDLELINENVGYASGGATFDNFNEGQVTKTTNGGETWNKILTTVNITSISFINANVGFYSNFDKEIFKTIDGGINWNKISILQYSPLDILFQNIEVGYVATYEGKILITKNGGYSWEVAYAKTNVPINKIIKTPNYIFAVGNYGLVIKSK